MKNNQSTGSLGYIGQVMTRAMKSNCVGYRKCEAWPGERRCF